MSTLNAAPQSAPRQLLWLRNDLRIQDNTALTAAMQAGPTLAIYLISPAQWLAHDDAPCKVDFWLRNLVELQKDLAALNVPLLIRRAEQWQHAPDVLAQVSQQFNISAVHVNTEYGIHESQRDLSVGALLVDQGILFHPHFDQLLFKPGSPAPRPQHKQRSVLPVTRSQLQWRVLPPPMRVYRRSGRLANTQQCNAYRHLLSRPLMAI